MDLNPTSLRDDTSNRVLPLGDIYRDKKHSVGSNMNAVMLDKDERELIKKGEEVTKQEMWDLLENKRFEKLKSSAVNLQGDMIFNKRCPKCTLVPPCKHFES